MPCSPFDGAMSSFSYPLFINVEKTQVCSANRLQCITRLINKSETIVMVSCLIPHRSSKILLCSYSCPSFVDSLLCSYSCPSSVDSYCVLLTVHLPSIPRIVRLLTTFLVPSLIVGYLPTVISVATATLLVLILCLSKKLTIFKYFSDLKETCNPRLATLVMGLIPPGLLMTLHRF